MTTFRLELEINLLSPLHIGTGEGFAGIIDRRTLSYRDHNSRLPIVLGHSVKGIVRDQYKKLASIYTCDPSAEVCLFGSENCQGMLYFSPWEITEQMKKLVKGERAHHLFDVKAGNQIVRGRRVAKHEHLFTHEVVKDKLTLTGSIEGMTGDERIGQEWSNDFLLLLFAIKNISRIGGRRRAGSGACTVRLKQLWWKDKNEEDTLDEEGIHKLLIDNINRLIGEGANA